MKNINFTAANSAQDVKSSLAVTTSLLPSSLIPDRNTPNVAMSAPGGPVFSERTDDRCC